MGRMGFGTAREGILLRVSMEKSCLVPFRPDEELAVRNPVMRSIVLLLGVALSMGLVSAQRRPMEVNLEETTSHRWLEKKVHATRLLDDMESIENWALENTQQATGSIKLAAEPRYSGDWSLRLSCPTTGSIPIPSDRYFGFARVQRQFSREDWSGSNRISFWVYPDMPGFKQISLLTILHNDGVEKVPDIYGKMGLNYVLLRNREWNHIVWEIGNLARDAVTSFEFQYRMQGNEPLAAREAVFYFDRLELQSVDQDHFEGWNVAPGQISYSHMGYLPGFRKQAFTSEVGVGSFSVRSVDTGKTAFSGNVEYVDTVNGRFGVMDFTDLKAAGTFELQAGELKTRPFDISSAVWDETIEAVLNFFYAERCGVRVPGVHEACHRDWLARHDERSILINGGWHDAGDLSQGLKNTSEAVYAMFALADYLGRTDQKRELQSRLIEEAQWGLGWVMKTVFEDGARVGWATHDRWTNGVIGDADDMVAGAWKSADASFMAAASEAIAARVLREVDPGLADLALQQAQADWAFGLITLKTPPDWDRDQAELASLAGQASIELFKAAGESKYAETAFEMAAVLLESQQKEFLQGLTRPITGFFYLTPEKEQLLRYEHSSHQQGPVVLLSDLCRLFPGHEEWFSWYSAVALYSRFYVEEMSQLAAPYNMLANALHREDDHARIPMHRVFPGANPEGFLDQIRNGVPVGDGLFVRRFPVWFVFRGNSGTLLSEAVGLAAAGALRNSHSAAGLAQEQLMWVIGRNPFGQSQMFGVGYDYPPQYAAMFGDQVGATAVGIQTRHERDVPYWPTENCHNWKETWVHPAVRWLQMMPFLYEESADAAGVERVEPAGDQSFVQIKKRSEATAESGEVTVVLSAEGRGAHRLEFQAENLELETRGVGLELGSAAEELVVKGRLTRRDRPWLLVVIADGDKERLVESSGSLLR